MENLETIIRSEISFLPVWVFDEVRGTLQHLLLPVFLSVRSETEKYKRYRCQVSYTDKNYAKTDISLLFVMYLMYLTIS